MAKGPDGKTIRPDEDPAQRETRAVRRNRLQDRVSRLDDEFDDDDQVPTHMTSNMVLPTGDKREPAAGGGGGPATAGEGGPKDEPDTQDAAPAPRSVPNRDPNVTQVFRPKRQAADEEASGAAGAGAAKQEGSMENQTVSDPVVGWLVVTHGPGRGSALPIGYGNNRIGRSETMEICLNFGDGQISRDNHAIVTYDGKHKKFYIQQGGGRNLTHVDDQLVMTPVELKGGETVSLGDTKLGFVPFCGEKFDWHDQ